MTDTYSPKASTQRPEAPAASPGSPPIIVFVGPSFPPARVGELLPSAEVRQPIRRDDLASIEAPAIVAIIDGVFDAELAVSPREIRTAIARGVRVVGASSMGALRAAEVHEMLGVGRIYEMFRSGSIERDDEVAVLLDEESGRALTEPLVNIRYAVDTLIQSGTIDRETGVAIVETASALHFHDRAYRNIVRKAGLGERQDAEHLILALRSIDLKREDAQTLLENIVGLGADAHWSRPYSTGESRHEYHDHFANVRIQTSTRADASLLVWEFGDKLDWTDIVTFLAATGKLDMHARRVLARSHVDEPSHIETSTSLKLISVQELFDLIMNEWGWHSAEEVHVTLNDLGIGFDALQARLRDERNVRRKLRALWATTDESFLEGLRIELLMTDIALKREVMRLGALQVMARQEPEPPTEQELEDARRALLCERPELTWEGLLDEVGASDARVHSIVSLVARARRVGVALFDTMNRGHRRDGTIGKGLATLPIAPYAVNAQSRSIEDAEAARIARGLGKVIGVTRVAQLGELERFGLHVTSAYRASEWSSTIGSGKSASLEGAVAGALMEELEKYSQELFQPDIAARGSFEELGPERAIDPFQCALPFDSNYEKVSRLAWSWMSDLVTGEKVLVPDGLLSLRRTVNDVLYSPRRGRRVFSSNGLASGFSLTEAIVHALSERIERHALKLAEQAVSNPGTLPSAERWPFTFIELESCPESTQHIIAGIELAGYKARVMDITSEIGVPTFSARIFRPKSQDGLDGSYYAGFCTHPNPTLALNRALLEAVQTRIAGLSGAREDFSIKARSLGRHERPRPLSRGDAYWIRPYVPKKPLSSVHGITAQSAREDAEFIVRRLTAAGFHRVLYRDLSRSETAPASVVRVLVPGMEDTNPFHTGLRARTLAVQDLMRRHEW